MIRKKTDRISGLYGEEIEDLEDLDDMDESEDLEEEKSFFRTRTRECILYVTFAFTFIFIGMIVYFGYFIQVRSQNIIGSSYNARLDRFTDRVVRGKILSADGKELAMARVSPGGEETRYYPYDYLYLHAVGYSGKNGKTGLESLGNFYLLSSHANLIERVANEFMGEKNAGDNLVTTLDSRLQETADAAIGKRRGAVIAMRPDTGAILAMVSQPNFSANAVDERWEELNEDSEEKAWFVNRASQGLYPPGSTFKILTLLEYIRENPDDWKKPTGIRILCRPLPIPATGPSPSSETRLTLSGLRASRRPATSTEICPLPCRPPGAASGWKNPPETGRRHRLPSARGKPRLPPC